MRSGEPRLLRVGVRVKCFNDPQYSSLEGTELIFWIKKALYFCEVDHWKKCRRNVL